MVLLPYALAVLGGLCAFGRADDHPVYGCQPGGADVDDGDCIVASQGLLDDLVECNGKVKITQTTATHRHKTCCATIYINTYPTPPDKVAYRSIDYLMYLFAQGISNCGRGHVYLDFGINLVHNFESCPSGAVGSRALGGNQDGEEAGARNNGSDSHVGDRALAARSGIDICGRGKDATNIPVDLLAAGYELVRTSTGSGTGKTLQASFIQGAWSSLFIMFKGSQADNKRLSWKYNKNGWYYAASMYAAAASWAGVQTAIGGQRAMDEVIHKVIYDAGKLGVSTVTYAIKNIFTGDAVTKFSVTNMT